jgi:hypothetical protein
MMKDQAKKKASDSMKNGAKDALKLTNACRTGADTAAKKNQCKVEDKARQTARKDTAKEALKVALGVESVEDYEVEKFLVEGAALQVGDAMDGCMQSVDSSLTGADKIAAMKECDNEAMKTFKEARMYDDVETETDPIVKKMKQREIEYEFKRTKETSAKNKAWASVKAKMDEAKSAGTDMNTETFKNEKRDMAKEAFKKNLAVGDIGEVELEEMLEETAKLEASKKLDSCYDIAMTKASSERKGYLSGCQTEAMATAKDARMDKHGSAAMTDTGFKKMMNDVAKQKAASTMAATMRAKPNMSEREKLDAVKKEMKKSLATDDDISDTKIKAFLKEGAIMKTRDVAKTTYTDANEKRKSVQAAMKESLGNTDITETDAEMFLKDAAVEEVGAIMSACVDSKYGVATKTADCEKASKDAYTTFMYGQDADLAGADAEKKKMKEREIDYEYKRTKNKAAQKRALGDVKAKMEDAISKNIDMNTETFKNEKRDLAKEAFKKNLALENIGDVKLEEMLKETSKREAGEQLDACYDGATAITNGAAKKTAFTKCKTDAKAAAMEIGRAHV